MNLSLHDPFTLAQDSPEALVNDLRSGHATTLRFNRKGDYLASGRVDGKLVIWDMETMGVAMKLNGHWKQIQSISWSHCGRYLLSASQDCRACLWDLQTQRRLRTAKFAAPIYLAELHPSNHNLFVCSLFEDHPYLVDLTNVDPIKYRLPTKPIDQDDTAAKQQTTSTVFSVQGNHIISGTSKGYINIIETATRKIIHSTKLSSGLISLIRLTTNGRQMLVNSTDRIIRVVDMPDLSIIRPIDSIPSDLAHTTADSPPQDPDHDHEDNMINPATLPSYIHLHTSHKFQDLVNRLRWNDTAFSHISSASGSGMADYVTASTYMKRDIYIWELASSSLLRILENAQEPAIIEWHPTKPLLACTGIETGSIQIWGIEPQQKWSALAPDFTEVAENVEYEEREDEFDTLPSDLLKRQREDAEDSTVDVLNITSTSDPNELDTAGSRGGREEQSFVLPMLYDIEDSEAEDALIKLTATTYRKKDVHEGKDYELDQQEATPRRGEAARVDGKAGRKK
ncbi:chromatin binding protein [Lithohypha guttulata]|uniref:Chromatin binding protein n=1 Tax=Lithohypha guttulata TaxID=1690604 RepID=A0AAN7T7Z7_9EURO|nr:chromatin binding protein [Lithohypha guttulata]